MRSAKIVLLGYLLLVFTFPMASYGGNGDEPSRLNPKQPILSATLEPFSPNPAANKKFGWRVGWRDTVSVPPELLSKIVGCLSQGTHLYNDREGSPSPQLTYILNIKQKGVEETFYFLDDFEIITFDLPENLKSEVTKQMSGIVEKVLSGKS